MIGPWTEWALAIAETDPASWTPAPAGAGRLLPRAQVEAAEAEPLPPPAPSPWRPIPGTSYEVTLDDGTLRVRNHRGVPIRPHVGGWSLSIGNVQRWYPLADLRAAAAGVARNCVE